MFKCFLSAVFQSEVWPNLPMNAGGGVGSGRHLQLTPRCTEHSMGMYCTLHCIALCCILQSWVKCVKSFWESWELGGNKGGGGVGGWCKFLISDVVYYIFVGARK